MKQIGTDPYKNKTTSPKELRFCSCDKGRAHFHLLGTFWMPEERKVFLFSQETIDSTVSTAPTRWLEFFLSAMLQSCGCDSQAVGGGTLTRAEQNVRTAAESSARLAAGLLP